MTENEKEIKIAIEHLKVRNMSAKHIEMAIKALEKQVPKKDNNDRCRCKNCGTYNNFIIDNLFNPEGHPVVYCWNCGQAISLREGE